MFMFRLIVYFYDLRHDKTRGTLWQSLSYFFMLPNACFPLYPVIDYKTYRRNYYDEDAYRIYQVGVDWMVRLFAATEKSTGYYFENRLFLLKLALFILIVVLEIGPAITLVRWRLAVRRGELPGTERAVALARISAIQTVLVVAIVFAATAMARGVGSP
jgi:uncharacterized membrane protein